MCVLGPGSELVDSLHTSLPFCFDSVVVKSTNFHRTEEPQGQYSGTTALGVLYELMPYRYKQQQIAQGTLCLFLKKDKSSISLANFPMLSKCVSPKMSLEDGPGG